ncbi:MAG: hypothetical protein ACR2NP_11330, partial [Pirellulaceae bacterium]
NVLCGWDLETAERVFPSDDAMQMAKGIQQACLLDGRLFVTSGEAPVSVHDLDTGDVAYQIDPASHLETSWSSVRLLPATNGMIVHSTGGFLVVEPRSGEVIQAREQPNQGLFAARRDDVFAFVDENVRNVWLHRVLGRRSRPLMRLGDDLNGISDLAMLDDQFLALTDNNYPRELQIWSLPEQRVIDRYVSEDYFEMAGASGAVIAGINNSNRLVVFASPRPDNRPIDEARFQELIQQLDSPRYRERKQATEQLIRGGGAVATRLESFNPVTAESRVRVEHIRARVKAARLPSLEQPLAGDPRLDADVEIACVDPQGGYVLAAKRKGWRSELFVCRVVDTERYEVIGQGELRSRVALIESAWQQPDTFVIGYKDGTLDVIRIEIPED